MAGHVQLITSDDDFGPTLMAAGDRLVVVDFFATWLVRSVPGYIEFMRRTREIHMKNVLM